MEWKIYLKENNGYFWTIFTFIFMTIMPFSYVTVQKILMVLKYNMTCTYFYAIHPNV